MKHTTPLVDIIVPTHENEKLTSNCFESIKAHTENYRIIWVDNGSKNYEMALEAIQGAEYDFVRFDENKGFVGATNEGLRRSKAPYVCLLNNDTLVTPRWLEKLVRHLKHNRKLGIVGPLTVSDSFEEMDSGQNIAHQGTIRELPEFTNLIEFNRRLEKQHKGATSEPPDFIAFLCAVIKREVIDAVGYLDTNYSMGLWDDNDYDLAAKEAGYTSALALDTCIYHKGRSTFRLFDRAKIDKIHDDNHEYFRKKWNIR